MTASPALADRRPPGPGTRAEPATKHALLVLSHAMERAFAAAPCATGLVVAWFQQRAHFDVERARYAALAAAGHTVVVAFAGPVDGLPPGVHAVALADDDPRAQDWVLVTARGACATALVATDVHALAPDGPTLEASRSFTARWTLRRDAALQAARTQLDRLADGLEPAVLAAALAHVSAGEAAPVLPGEAQLAAAAEHLMASVAHGQRRAARLRLELRQTRSLAERDQLTGLLDRHFLERFLGAGDRAAELLVLLVDVDGLKRVDDGHGHAAGDALLRTVAGALLAHSRPGDVCVRWGGDEFLLLAPFTPASAGLALGTRLAHAVAAAVPEQPWQGLVPSVSIGVCPSTRTALPLDRLDAALYGVKRAGGGGAAVALPRDSR